MTGETGEVAIREHGGVTAVETDSLDGKVSVNLDHDPPLVGVPEEVGVLYEDAESDETEETATDGGRVQNAVRVRQYGIGLEGEQRNLVVAIMSGAFAVAGYLWNSSQASAFIVFCAALVLAYLLFYWGDYRGGSETGDVEVEA